MSATMLALYLLDCHEYNHIFVFSIIPFTEMTQVGEIPKPKKIILKDTFISYLSAKLQYLLLVTV